MSASSSKTRVRRWVAAGAGVSTAVALLSTAPLAAAAPEVTPSSDLFFSEYVEGSSNNKALEIYNGTGASVDLAAGDYAIAIYFNGATTPTTFDLTGTVADGDVFVFAHADAAQVVLNQADQTTGAGLFNGDDAIALMHGSDQVDVIGQIGFDPGSQWGTGEAATQNNTMRRKSFVTDGDPDGSDAFNPAVEWNGYQTDVFNGLGTHNVTPPTIGECGDDYTPIPAIQGSGADAAITGTVETEGVVVGDYEGPSPALRGFYVQDPTGDGDAATSDAIFVFNGNTDSVSLGDRVRIHGNAGEFQGQTQISDTIDGIAVCGSDATVPPTPVQLPFADAAEPERYEGMLVTLPQTLTVTEHFQLGRFGQVLLSSDGRLAQPTNVVEPGDPAGELQAANDLNQILVDDALNNQNPDPIRFARGGQPLSAQNTLRGGDTATGIVGVMTYTWAGNSASPNAYRVRPVNALGGSVDFEVGNPRPAAPDPVGGDLRVASFNVLNYFNTFGDDCSGGVSGEPMECRGADGPVELERQADKIVSALSGLDADVVGVIEIENDGYGPDSAIADLTDRLNAATAPGTYAFIDADAGTGQVDALGADAIKVGLLYKPAAVTPVGTTAALNTESFVNGVTDSPKNRPALAQTFQDDDGGRVTVVVNHLKSKGSDCEPADPDTGDGQGNCNLTRVAAANELAQWLAGDPTGVDDADALVMGDLNSYAMEDPITALRDAGFTNLVREFEGPDAYSYVFDGQWGYLDHALASASLAGQVTGATTWHINADEPSVLDYNTDFKSPGQVESLYAPGPYRSSDHDPVLVGLDLTVGKRVTSAWVTGAGIYRQPGDGLVPFGVSVKYTPYRERPTGVVTAWVPDTGLLISTRLDWLTTDVERGTAKFTGSATVIGRGGDYRLTGWVHDGGRSDTLRLLVTDASGAVVYDSGERPVLSGNLKLHG